MIPCSALVKLRVLDGVPISALEAGEARDQEAKNRPNIPYQEKFHLGILKGVYNISDTL